MDVDFDYLSAIGRRIGRIEISSQLADLAWNTVVLYPAGHFSRDIHFLTNIVCRSGWNMRLR